MNATESATDPSAKSDLLVGSLGFNGEREECRQRGEECFFHMIAALGIIKLRNGHRAPTNLNNSAVIFLSGMANCYIQADADTVKQCGSAHEASKVS
jgi:hypothetical protein